MLNQSLEVPRPKSKFPKMNAAMKLNATVESLLLFTPVAIEAFLFVRKEVTKAHPEYPELEAKFLKKASTLSKLLF